MNKVFPVIFTYIILSIAAYPARVYSDEHVKPKQIFKHDYVRSGGGGAGVSVNTKKHNADTVRREGSKIKEKENRDSFFEFDEETADNGKEEIAPDDEYNTAGKGLPVVWVGAVIDVNNREHMLANLEQVTTLATKHDWMLGVFFLLGTPDFSTLGRYSLRINARKGLVRYISKVPKKYQAVQKSPTWIVQTPKGQVLLEATGPLKKHFNKKGELVLPDDLTL